MARSFIIPFDFSRYSRLVAESGSYIATVPSDSSTVLLGTLEVEGTTFLASIPTDNYLVEKFYPVVEQEDSCINLKNTFLPYTLSVGKKT